jgi:hypothetical protein
MPKITIEDLYRGEKYDIMSAVTAKALTLGVDERTEDGRRWIETELVRQTVIAMLKLNKNGDCISDKEIGDAVAVSAADEIMGRECWVDRELGIVMMTAMQYALLLDNSDTADIIDCIMCFLRHIDTYSLQIMLDSLKKRPAITKPEKEWLNESWEHLQTLIERELKRMR